MFSLVFSQVFDPTCCLQVICVTLLQPDTSFSCHESCLIWSFWLPDLDYGVVPQRLAPRAHKFHNFLKSWLLSCLPPSIRSFSDFSNSGLGSCYQIEFTVVSGPNPLAVTVVTWFKGTLIACKNVSETFQRRTRFKKWNTFFFYFWEASQWYG